MVLQAKVASVLIKVGSVSCDPDCPYCTCVVYPNNSVRTSCELEDGALFEEVICKKIS